jgi:hypothetical protein
MQCDSLARAAARNRDRTMTASMPNSPRRLACARCGATFECASAGGCWCAAEPYRLPMPDAAGEDCLCPACLRKAAAERAGN